MINLQLLGGLDIGCPTLSANARARRRRPLALLALLGIAAPKPLARDRITAFLWPESDAERAGNSLRQALFWLRRDLGEDVLLPETASGLQLDPARLTVDLWAFRDALDAGAPERAVLAYRGPLLDGFHIPDAPEFGQWIESHRTQLEQRHIAALELLARTAEEDGRWNDAVSWRRRQAAADPFSARAALALLRALKAAGDRSGALAHASIYESVVREQLEVEPDPSVTEFVAGLRRDVRATGNGGRSDGNAPAPHQPVVPAEATPTLIPPRVRSPRPWLVGVTAVGIVGMAAMAFAPVALSEAGDSVSLAAARTVIVLASGVEQVADRDPANRLVACSGPACPARDLPQAAYVVPRHGFHAMPVAGTSYIAPIADGTTARAPGYACCTTATFENEFQLPKNAGSATITMSLLADNAARVEVNGVEFGRQPDSLGVANYSEPWSYRATFTPDQHGINRLRVTLWDGGGAVALHYHAVVTWAADGDDDAHAPAMRGNRAALTPR